MRPGLVAVGIAFAVLGAAVMVAVINPADDPMLTRSSSIALDRLPATEWRTFNVSAVAASPATISISWNSTGGVVVEWFATAPCATPPHRCAEVPALAAWTGSERSGSWTGSGSSGPAYLLYVYADPSSSVNFSSVFSEHYRSSDLSLPLVPFAVTLAGGAILTGVGGVLLYLGIFLPAGVYAPTDPGLEPEEDAPAGPPSPSDSRQS